MEINAKYTMQSIVDRLRIRKRKLFPGRRIIPFSIGKSSLQKGSMSFHNPFLMKKVDHLESGLTSGLVPTSAVPLFLQTEEEWASLPYGTDGGKNIAENGCAIVVLAMVGNHYGLHTTPNIVQEWAKNDYYLYIAGTSWNIFPDFAFSYGLHYRDLGNNIELAKEELTQNHLVVVSVKEGHFTDVGHMMLLTNYKKNQFSINDPNDDMKKLHSFQWFKEEDIAESSLNFWSMYK